MARQPSTDVQSIAPVLSDSRRLGVGRCLRKLELPTDAAGFDDLLACLDELPGSVESTPLTPAAKLEPTE